MRLDKWLWAARFFKTRQLAAEAINGGKIEVEGQGAKPGRPIRPGARLIIHKDSLVWEIQILALAPQRRPAAEAALRNPGTAPAKQVEMAVELPPGMKFVSGSNQAYYEENTRTGHWKLEEIPVQDGPPPVQLTLMPTTSAGWTTWGQVRPSRAMATSMSRA